VQALRTSPGGWQLMTDDTWQPACFDAVMLALPPAQAAPLLAPHGREWAQRASLALMQPCWTLMGVADAPRQSSADGGRSWQGARPTRGPLAMLSGADADIDTDADTDSAGPRRSGQQAWVAHARPAWSREHLEQPAAWVQAQLQAAVADWLGQALSWQCAVVHRWRYAMPRNAPLGHDHACWWSERLSLGVCGDFLGGQGANGVEGAWLSGTALARSLLAGEGAATMPSETAPAVRVVADDCDHAQLAMLS
jgi:renalase